MPSPSEQPINEVIADLVTRGFVLPEGLTLGEAYDPIEDCKEDEWKFGYGKPVRMADSQALDLIACAFARQLTHSTTHNARLLGISYDNLDLIREWLGKGDTEPALRVLWEATG